MGVKYSHIEVGSLESASPDTIRRDVEPCAVLRVGSGTRKTSLVTGSFLWHKTVRAPLRSCFCSHTWLAAWMVSSHSVMPGHRGRLLCAM